MARPSFIVCLSVFLFKVIPDSVQESGSSSTLISCQHAVIEWAQYNMPPLDLCHTACNETDKICVQTSREHDQNNVSALCRDRRLTSQEVFLVYQHCQGERTPCHLEAVPGLLGHMTASYKCLEDDIQVIDPCEEGSYRGTSVYFLYGYHRVASTSSAVTCTCSLNKTNDTSDVHVSGVNVYSPVADGLPVFAVQHDNKREHINDTFPKAFIITSRTALVSLTLTVSATHKIGRVWASVAQQGDSQFFVNCVTVQGTVPVDSHQTVGVSWMVYAQVIIDTTVVLCLAVYCVTFCWNRRLKKKMSVGDGESERWGQSAVHVAQDTVQESNQDNARVAGSHEGTAPRPEAIHCRRALHILRHVRNWLRSQTGNVHVI